MHIFKHQNNDTQHFFVLTTTKTSSNALIGPVVSHCVMHVFGFTAIAAEMPKRPVHLLLAVERIAKQNLKKKGLAKLVRSRMRSASKDSSAKVVVVASPGSKTDLEKFLERMNREVFAANAELGTKVYQAAEILWTSTNTLPDGE